MRRQQFNEWANTQLRRGVDFGIVPGTDKPTLLKPGAEKIAQLFGCAPELDEVHREQDPNSGYLYIEYRCRMVNLHTGQTLAHGIGSCCSYESKYRWRWEWWNGKGLPEGAEWEQTRTGKWRKRVENRDLIDQWNTVIKIAKKRAMVDATLTISGASEKFTQDIEDMPEFEPAASEPSPDVEASPSATTVKAPAWQAAFWAWVADYMTKQGLDTSVVKKLYAWAKGKGYFKEHLGLYDTMAAAQTDYMTSVGWFLKEQPRLSDPEPVGT